ncbi:MAG TPA: hypothetical protein VFK58_01535 [Sphingomicrobium sp.]|nr:hypothetical protein [Sphingomicrobium sp.]
MNAPFSKPATKLPDDFAAMQGQADKWRGECIQQFAQLEETVETLLRALRDAPKQGGKVTVGLQVGAAFKHVRELTGSKGPFAGKGKAISATLADLAPWFEWRAHLTHGVLAVWRGRNDQWLLALAHRASGDDPIRTYALTWDDARAMRRLLQDRTEALRENARSLANSVLKT